MYNKSIQKQELENIKPLLFSKELDFVKQGLYLWETYLEETSFGELWQQIRIIFDSEQPAPPNSTSKTLYQDIRALCKKTNHPQHIVLWLIGALGTYPEFELTEVDLKTDVLVQAVPEKSWFMNLYLRHHPTFRNSPLTFEELPELYLEIPQLQIFRCHGKNLNANINLLLELTALETLDMNLETRDPAHQLRLPEEIGNFKTLEKLLLSNNGIASLPDSIGKLKTLKHLGLSNNQLRQLPSTIGNLAQLQGLSLSNNKLCTVPESMGKLKNLEHLKLSENKLETIPSSFGALQRLKSLRISKNNLSVLPACISRLANLQTLRISHNHLRVLPESIGGLQNLTLLNLSKNKLKDLPESIGDLQNLNLLNLLGNPLRTLPESIGRLENLKILNLQETNISNLPESIGDLQNLSSLYLPHNHFCWETRSALQEKLPSCRIR